ncbi:MAG: hypothetical protein HC840_01375 [Leptolyngbyaceae cyanobacterium RM2_2_4]|nr:hypothetical protein [Leptolyngbyaceae cyanobacterium RM2_2_4]
MNIEFADRLAAAGTLTGDNFKDVAGVPRQWSAIYAHDTSIVKLTSNTMTIGDGATAMSETVTRIAQGSYYYGLFTKIEWVSGDVTCYRKKGQ